MRKSVATGLALAVGTGITLAALVPVMYGPARSSPPAAEITDSAALAPEMPGAVEAPVLGLVSEPVAPTREVTIPAGTRLFLQLDQAVGSDLSRVEEPVRASLVRPLVVEGQTVVSTGSAVTGVVTQARRSGKVKGRAYLAMRFTSLTPKGQDEPYALRTRPWAREARATKKEDAVKIGVPAGAGAAIGAIAGGKKGAGIGAAVGGGAGTAVVLSTRGEEVRLGPGARVIVVLAEPLIVRVTA